MKQNFKKFAAVMVAVATIIGAYSYANTKELTNTWVFTGSLLEDAEDITLSNYEMNPTSYPTGCGTPNAPLPCQFDIPTAVDDISKLEAYLHAEFGETAEEIRDGADSRRP